MPATGAPDSVFAEIEFTAGVWTDVSAYVDWSAGASTQYGRSTQYGPPQAAGLTLTLDNTDGRFSPLRQTLKDGTTVHPYYPNVVPRKRIRVGYVKTATRYIRYTGYVKGWPPGFKDGTRERVVIAAVDRSLQLQTMQLKQPIAQEVDYLRTAESVAAYLLYWTLNDDAGSTMAVEAYGGKSLTSSAPPTFGVDGPVVGNGTAAQFVSASFQALTSGWVSWLDTGATVSAWVKPTASGSTMTVVGVSDPDANIDLQLRFNASLAPEVHHQGVTVTSGSPVTVNQWVHLAASISGGVLALYVNGVSVGTGAVTGFTASARVVVGRSASDTVNYLDGIVGHVAVTNGAVLTTTDLLRLTAAGNVGVGETVDTRIARLLRYANVAPASYNLDASTVTLATYDQAGKTPFDAAQELVDSEGPGSAVYIDTDDRVRFVNRDKLRAGAPAVTFDAAADLDGSTWEPAYDADNLVNSSIGSRSSASGTLDTATAVDTTSVTAYGTGSGDFTSYAQSGADVLGNAQARVAAGKTPGFRLNRVTVDLWTAQNDLYASSAAIRIGDRIRVSSIPAGAAPTTQVDLVVQGWTDTFSDTGYSIAFDTIPADTPAWFIWDTSTTVGSETNAYSRWQSATGSQQLNASITSVATTLVVITQAGQPTFTTSAGAYPLIITVGVEQIQLNSAPGGSGSPQTFTGVTRGVNGTTAAAQASASAVDLYPASTWTL